MQSWTHFGKQVKKSFSTELKMFSSCYSLYLRIWELDSATLPHNWIPCWNLNKWGESTDQLNNASQGKPGKMLTVPWMGWWKWNVKIEHTAVSWTAKVNHVQGRIEWPSPAYSAQRLQLHWLYGVRPNSDRVSVTTRRSFMSKLFCRTFSVSSMYSVLHDWFATAEIMLFDREIGDRNQTKEKW